MLCKMKSINLGQEFQLFCAEAISFNMGKPESKNSLHMHRGDILYHQLR